MKIDCCEICYKQNKTLTLATNKTGFVHKGYISLCPIHKGYFSECKTYLELLTKLETVKEDDKK